MADDEEHGKGFWDFAISCVKTWWVWAFAALGLGMLNVDNIVAIIRAIKGG